MLLVPCLISFLKEAKNPDIPFTAQLASPLHWQVMKQQIALSAKAYLIRGAFYLLLLVSLTAIPFAVSQWEARGQRTLTFAEHVAYQRAIEEVY